QRHGVRAPRPIGGGVFAPEPRRQRPQLAVRLRDRDAGLQPEQRLHEVGTAAVLRQVPPKALPYVRVAGKLKSWRHDAGYRERLAVQRDDASDDRWIRIEA